MSMLQNSDLEGTGTDHPCVPKAELMRQMSSLGGQGGFKGTGIGIKIRNTGPCIHKKTCAGPEDGKT